MTADRAWRAGRHASRAGSRCRAPRCRRRGRAPDRSNGRRSTRRNERRGARPRTPPSLPAARGPRRRHPLPRPPAARSASSSSSSSPGLPGAPRRSRPLRSNRTTALATFLLLVTGLLMLAGFLLARRRAPRRDEAAPRVAREPRPRSSRGSSCRGDSARTRCRSRTTTRSTVHGSLAAVAVLLLWLYLTSLALLIRRRGQRRASRDPLAERAAKTHGRRRVLGAPAATVVAMAWAPCASSISPPSRDAVGMARGASRPLARGAHRGRRVRAPRPTAFATSAYGEARSQVRVAHNEAFATGSERARRRRYVVALPCRPVARRLNGRAEGGRQSRSATRAPCADDEGGARLVARLEAAGFTVTLRDREGRARRPPRRHRARL